MLMACTPGNSSANPQISLTPEPMEQARVNQAQKLPITAKVTIAGQVIQLEVARTPREQQIGLMYRPSVPANQGMLFPFPAPQAVSFWMKNVSIPLDMVFLRAGKVQAIAANVPPCQADPCPVYGPGPNVLVDQVLELRTGRAAELGLKPGDRLSIQFLRPSRTPAGS